MLEDAQTIKSIPGVRKIIFFRGFSIVFGPANLRLIPYTKGDKTASANAIVKSYTFMAHIPQRIDNTSATHRKRIASRERFVLKRKSLWPILGNHMLYLSRE